MGGKYQAYPDYKNSGVKWFGSIPSHWRVAGFKKYLESIVDYRGKTPSKTDHGILLVTARNIKNGSLDYTLSQEFIAEEDYDDVMSRGKPNIGDLLFTTEAPLGEVSNVNKTDIALAQRVIKFCGKEGVLNNYYFKYLVMSEEFQQSLYLFASGSTVKGIKAERFVYLRKLLPTVGEQVQIANFLDHETAKIDTLIEKQQRLIKLLKEKRQAVISHAVTKGLNSDAPMRDSGIEWLGEVPEHWRVKKFSHCASIRNGQVDPTKFPYSQYILIAPNHIESGTGRLLLMETAEEQAADSGKYLCKKGEVIYSKIRPALAKACLSLSDQTICSADMYPVQGMNGLTNNFLLWTLLSGWFTSLVILESDRVAMPKINREKLADVRLPIPPMNEQQKICSEVRENISVIDTLLGKADKSIKLSRERRTALISAAVTGKIDVRGWQVPQQGNKEDAA